MAGRHLSFEEASKYLHIEPDVLTRMVKQRDVPFTPCGERICFDAEELDTWASQRILKMGRLPLSAYHRGTSLGTRCREGRFSLVSSLFAPNRMATDLRSRTKAAVIRDLVAVAEAAGLLYAPADLVRSLAEREAACSTGLAGGVALVHPRHHDPYLAPDSFALLARTETPIPFGAPDGENTDVFFLICCLDDRLHLHVLARLCTMLGTTDLLARIRAAEDADALLAAISDSETHVLAQLRQNQ